MSSNSSQVFDHNLQTAKQRYEKMVSTRRSYTDRAEKCAKYTIPMAFPKATDNSNTNYETPYQSIGARGVNNLTAKLMLALFPPNEPFFRLGLGEDIKNAYDGDAETLQQYEQSLAKIERAMQDYMEENQIRTTMNEAILQLIVAGNCLLFLPPAEGGIRMYRLNNYVVSRDGVGHVQEIIAKESLNYMSIPEEARSCIQEPDIDTDKVYEIYTHTYRQDDVYISYQELNGQVINGSEQQYPVGSSPWIPLRLKKMDGESYGRSFVDEYIGDLRSLEGLSKSIVESAAISSNIIYLVNPNAITRISELSNARSGDFVKGRPEDVQALQVDKSSDLRVVEATIQSIEQRLSFAFLLNSAVQRDAERVTAEEIRFVANELEDTVGSIYSILSQELQLPLVKRIMLQMTSEGKLPDLPLGSQGVQPMIVTGLEALGRGHDLSRLDTFIRYAQVFPEAFQQRVKQGAILEQIATALGLSASSVVKSDEELQAEMAQAQQAQMMQDVAPEVVRGAMK